MPDSPLGRRLGLFPLTSIVVANMVGAGIFTTSGLLINELGSPAVMITLWVGGGVLALAGALSYGALGAALPFAGGEYLFLSRLYHPALGFLSGWTSLVVGFSAPIAASSIGFSEYLSRACPEMFSWTVASGPIDAQLLKKGLAVLVIVLFTLVHLRGIQFGGRVQSGLTLLKVGLLAGIIVLGVSFGRGDLGHFAQGKEFSFDMKGWKTLGLSLMWIMFAYSGWNASTYIGSEIRNPKRFLPLSLVAGTSLVTILYVALNVVFVYALSPEEMSGVLSVGGLAMANLFGRPMEIAASCLIAFSLFSSLSAFIILGPRVYFAMARDGYFFRFAAYVHPKSQVPSWSIVLQGLLGIIMVLSGTFDQILTFMGFALGIFPLLAVAALFRMKSPVHVAPLVYLVLSACILVLAFLERPVESSIALGTVAVGIPFYMLFARRMKGR